MMEWSYSMTSHFFPETLKYGDRNDSFWVLSYLTLDTLHIGGPCLHSTYGWHTLCCVNYCKIVIEISVSRKVINKIIHLQKQTKCLTSVSFQILRLEGKLQLWLPLPPPPRMRKFIKTTIIHCFAIRLTDGWQSCQNHTKEGVEF